MNLENESRNREHKKTRCLAVEGSGDPNEEGGAYRHAPELLYGVAYTLKMSHKTDHAIEGFHQYVVPPLEGFWWLAGTEGVDYADKASFGWVSAIRVPEFVGAAGFAWGVEAVTVTQTASGGATITITDGNGTTTADISRGAQGEKGDKGDPVEQDPKGDTGDFVARRRER